MTAGASAVALYARTSDGYESRVAHATAVLESAASAHTGRIVQATSLGAEDMVLTDLIARHHLPIAIGTLDTGMLHDQTLALVSHIERHYGIPVERHAPLHEATVQFVRRHGDRAMYDSVELRKACCEMRKLKPLARMLERRSAWITGLRREQSTHRGAVPFSERDVQGRDKLNPLADWSWADVWHYIASHDVPYNALHDQFYPSIGCAPCTRAIALGEDFRAGRWWWENEAAKECGLHIRPLFTAASAADGSRSESAGGSFSAQADFGAAEVRAAAAAGRSQNEAAKECGLHVDRAPRQHQEELHT
jgi:phosphoadenosine phosphosulfate reductase